MFIRKLSYLFLLGLSVFMLAACGTNAPPAVNTPTPNATLTAIFSQNDAQPDDSFATAAAQTAVVLTDAAEDAGGTLLSTPTMANTTNPTPSGNARQTTATATSVPGAASATPDMQSTLASGDEDHDAIVLNFEDEAEGEETDKSKRPGAGVQAFYLDSQPVIDGDLSDFQTPLYAMPYVVSGAGYHSGDTDLAGTFQIGWDESSLYLAVTVFDSKFKQEAGGPQLYRGDSLEILLDTNVSKDFLDAVLNDDDVQLGISPGDLLNDEQGEAYLWAPRIIEGPLPNVKVAARLTSDGYVIEVAIPWVSLGTTPYAGQHMGFLFSISDNDDPTQDTQQTVISFAPIRTLHDPTAWYDLWLIKP